MKVILADLIHNCVEGNNYLSGMQDYTVPLNVASIAAYASEKMNNSVEFSIVKYPNDLLSALKEGKPDIIGFSNYIWNSSLNSSVGSYIKDNYPDILIVMGGPSIRQDRKGLKEFLEKRNYVDVYIPSEGEHPFYMLLKAYLDWGRKFTRKRFEVPGCAFLENGKLCYRTAEHDGSFDTYSSPYLNGFLDDSLEKGLIPLFETNRGCPFECTYCVWGDSANRKILKFPLDKVYLEMEYVAKNYPICSSWIIADANFGIFERDIEIAKKIAEIKEKTPSLKKIIMWEAKNSTKRNIEIGKILKTYSGDTLIAVQTFEDLAQENIKRKNIRFQNLPRRIENYNLEGVHVRTDILYGLPGESYLGHLNTLRKCFDLGFNHIGIFNTILLPGSEMEAEPSREKYMLKTKHRLRQGMFGEYLGLKAIESEEIIQSNSTISESEMRSLRPLHWLIWYGWNQEFLKPILKYAHNQYGINPLDILIDAINNKSHPAVIRLFSRFQEDAASEWFDDEPSLREHYMSPKIFEELMKKGFSKVEFKYTALMILSRDLFYELLDLLGVIVGRMASSSSVDEIIKIVKAIRIEPDSYFSGFVKDKIIQIRPDLSDFVFSFTTSAPRTQNENLWVKLTKPVDDQHKITNTLIKYNYANDKLFAIEKTLGAYGSAFLYDIYSDTSELT
ncbi:MAG: B12-binding domain-containing radical SAM protein [Candidatus Nitrospinota bacterium M3_3B_026]